MLNFSHFYFVGIKGVGMTALASVLVDMGKTVRGADVADDFPTKPMLARLGVTIDDGFAGELPAETEVVIYTGSHGGSQNPLVEKARRRGIPTYTHAAALGEVSAGQKVVAVCGVGGKSTISAMLAWTGEQLRTPVSFAVGVGQIIGLAKTGQFAASSDYFVAEADEYIADPLLKNSAGAHFRFDYLSPSVIVCNNLRFDHPDVYRDFNHTKQVFGRFFARLAPEGFLVYNGDDQNLRELAWQLLERRSDVTQISYGTHELNDVRLADVADWHLQVPGEFNRMNALAALTVATQVFGWDRPAVMAALSQYRSVTRRLQNLPAIGGVEIWDDYAHHPSEVAAAIAAMQAHRPGKRLVVAFQPHTFSRTRQLLGEFATALATAGEVVLLDIFASAREEDDGTISSDDLARAVSKLAMGTKVSRVGTPADLRAWIGKNMRRGDVLLTLGAGDIYHAVTSD